ncbi:MAG: hypothetical protein U1D41_16640 [Nitrosomonas sp.]|uniref:hypothetical protein n=1 Tax=Nitrosomonas sp. TaxID=42353 RepID=UPI002731B277|nr:hypothetical protein [Nitrosomonas sp.]MDP1549340.1 hypothetical protein [Nitrosomonas sp.]MDP1933820.1 hypothetical protein [Nitrosomonas sp.]MDP3664749.1 hypothetical protein [Nitrosomonas sp.]MDZ4107741.1 hypothetical protein [Nitrosomonas sp.]
MINILLSLVFYNCYGLMAWPQAFVTRYGGQESAGDSNSPACRSGRWSCCPMAQAVGISTASAVQMIRSRIEKINGRDPVNSALF